MSEFNYQPGLDFARHLDQDDPLAHWRRAFVIDDPDLLYLDGNSLGRLPRRTLQRMQDVLHKEWGQNLIRSWGEVWFDAPQRVGEKIARLIGAAPGQVIVCDSTSINLFKLVLSALALRPGRTKIVSDILNFPSDLYIIQGVVRLLEKGHTLYLAPSTDEITPNLQALEAAIDEQTALVTLSHVAFKSGYLYQADSITARAHQLGALVLWDLSHSVGAVPIALDQWGADFAIGCTYKYINGGPGAPAFLYVRQELQNGAHSPIWGWFGAQSPFAFSLDYSPAPGIGRFLTGTPPLLSLLAMECGLDLLLEAGIEPIREKSIRLTDYLVALFYDRLSPLGYTLGTPRLSARRGSHVSLRHPEGYRINRALIEEMAIIPDFREPDNIRLGLAPLYTSFQDVWQAVDRLRQVVVDKRYLHYPKERLTVT